MTRSSASQSARIRSLRPAKESVDPWRPIGVELEDELTEDRRVVPSLTVFLAGAECPFTCVFCDLWRFTLDHPTPAGAIPRQIELALEEVELPDGPVTLKLYNASNFFDPRAVPIQDHRAIADLLERFDTVTVECHPRLIGADCRQFAHHLAGRLEVAMGLETTHPGGLTGLNKQMRLEDFDRAAQLLRQAGVGMRVFVLVNPPFVAASELPIWAVRSSEYAFRQGADRVTLIPTRGGNGELERLEQLGRFRPVDLGLVEQVFEKTIELGMGLVQVDPWDLERHANCDDCRQQRVDRLRRMNLTGCCEPPFLCDSCTSGKGD